MKRSKPLVVAEQTESSSKSPEAMLAAAVLVKAVNDATAHDKCDEKQKAIRFCTEPYGGYAYWRSFWCHVAGVDPDVFRERMEQRLCLSLPTAIT